MDYTALGKKVRQYRKKANMTQEELSEKTRYSTQHISHIETGKTKLSVECLLSLANALEVSLDQLVCGYVKASSAVLDEEVCELLNDCTPKEKEIMLETVKTLKAGLRVNKK